MSAIITLIESHQFLLPGTDRSTFESLLGRTHADRPVDLLRRNQAAGPLSDSDLLSACDLLSDPSVRDILRHELQRTSPISPPVFLSLIRATCGIPDLLPHIAHHLTLSPHRSSISLDLIRDPPSPGLDFLLQCALSPDDAAHSFLALAASQSAEIASRAHDRLLSVRPDSLAPFTACHLHRLYFDRSLQRAQSFSPDDLSLHSQVLVPLTLAATTPDRPTVKKLIDSLPISDTTDFDDRCESLGKLVEWGYSNSVLRFARHPIYFKRCRLYLFPMFRDTNHVFLLRLAMCALTQPRGDALLRKSPVLKWIVQAAQAGGCEFAGRAALRLPLAKEQFVQQVQLADALAELLVRTPNKSAMMLTLVPFAMRAGWVPSEYVVEAVAILLQVENSVDVARAMALAVVLVQRKEIAKKLSDPYCLDGVCRFLRSPEAPDCFVYAAVRFVIAIGPYLRLNEGSVASVEDALVNLRDVGIARAKNRRLVIVVLQAFAVLPRLEKWDALFRKCDVRKFVVGVKAIGGVSQKIGELLVRVEERC